MCQEFFEKSLGIFHFLLYIIYYIMIKPHFANFPKVINFVKKQAVNAGMQI